MYENYAEVLGDCVFIHPISNYASIKRYFCAFSFKHGYFHKYFKADILSSARILKAELHVLSLGGEDEWEKTRGKRMAIFLFNDLIEVVKVFS